jgi:hypothetical protein
MKSVKLEVFCLYEVCADKESSNTSVWILDFKNVCVYVTSTVYWSDFLAMDPEVPGSIPSTIRFF